MKEMSKKTKEFNDYRFGDLEYFQSSNHYMKMKRFNQDKTKIVVKIAGSHLFKTKYGYGLILDENHVQWLKSWQVSENYYGTEVLLYKEYWCPKEYGNFEDFFENKENLLFETWVSAAEEQENATKLDEDNEPYFYNKVMWAI